MKLGDVRFAQHGGLVVAHLTGEIDMSNAGRIGDAIVETVSNQELGLILDFSGLRYLDSAGIQVVFRLREQLRTRGQTLTLVIPAGSASADAIRLAGVTPRIDSFEALEDALRSLSSEQPDAAPRS